jgi:hypothetical protein
VTAPSTASAVVLVLLLAGAVAVAGALLGRFVLGLLTGILVGLALAATPPGTWINDRTAPAITAAGHHISSWLTQHGPVSGAGK